jgi:N-acetylglucosaminyldiphosphoundecaprenol N-acetyl-beta-D-mannosaminyltransferase
MAWTPPTRFRLAGVTVDAFTAQGLTEAVGEAIKTASRWVIANHNLHSLYLHRTDAEMRRFYLFADYCHIDGMPLILLAQAMGIPLTRENRITYLDWIDPLMARAEAESWHVFYLGSRPGVAAQGAQVLRGRYPHLKIAVHDGYFDHSGSANDAVLAAIDGFGTQILMVGMGMPRQEHWILQNAHKLGVNVLLPCGACIDYVAGVVYSPPRWTGKVGVEWMFRLFADPKRLWKRYLVEPGALVALMLWDFVTRRSSAP